MKKAELFFRFAFLPVLLLSLFFFLPSRSDSLHRICLKQLGTEIRLSFLGSKKNAQAFFMQAEQLIDDNDKLWSRYRPDSFVYQFNHRTTSSFTLPHSLYEMMQKSQYYYQLTQGAFDITILPAVLLFEQAQKNNHFPPRETLQKYRDIVSFSLLNINQIPNHSSFVLEAPIGVKIDLGGISKGHILLKLKKLALQHKSRGGLLDIGGDILCFGESPRTSGWRVGIENVQSILSASSSDELPLRHTLTLRDQAIATSGNYRRFYTIENKQYSHIINPRTCLPVDHAVQVSVVHEDPMMADVLATYFSILPPREALQKANKLDICVFWLYNEGGGNYKEVFSQQWMQQFSPQNKE